MSIGEIILYSVVCVILFIPTLIVIGFICTTIASIFSLLSDLILRLIRLFLRIND